MPNPVAPPPAHTPLAAVADLVANLQNRLEAAEADSRQATEAMHHLRRDVAELRRQNMAAHPPRAPLAAVLAQATVPGPAPAAPTATPGHGDQHKAAVLILGWLDHLTGGGTAPVMSVTLARNIADLAVQAHGVLEGHLDVGEARLRRSFILFGRQVSDEQADFAAVARNPADILPADRLPRRRAWVSQYLILRALREHLTRSRLNLPDDETMRQYLRAAAEQLWGPFGVDALALVEDYQKSRETWCWAAYFTAFITRDMVRRQSILQNLTSTADALTYEHRLFDQLGHASCYAQALHEMYLCHTFSSQPIAVSYGGAAGIVAAIGEAFLDLTRSEPLHAPALAFSMVGSMLTCLLADGAHLFIAPTYAHLAPTMLTHAEVARGDFVCSITLAGLDDVDGADGNIAQPVLVRTAPGVLHLFEYSALRRTYLRSGLNPATTLPLRPENILRLFRPMAVLGHPFDAAGLRLSAFSHGPVPQATLPQRLAQIRRLAGGPISSPAPLGQDMSIDL